MNAMLLKREIETLLGLSAREAEQFWRIASANAPRPVPGGPVPVPYPNLGATVSRTPAGSGFDGKYQLTSVRHTAGGSFLKELAACVLGAAGGDLAARRVWPLWLRVKAEIGRQPAQVRGLTAHELMHVVQQQDRPGSPAR